MTPKILVLLLAFLSASGPGAGPSIAAMPIDKLTATDLRDSFDEVRGKGKHEAVDILAPKGTPVRAVVAGTIQKFFLSKPGGKTIYLFDEQGKYCYYYAHLDAYRDGLREGQKVIPGEMIGYVGSTGNADERVPHLHFAIFELTPLKQWWKGEPINPYPLLARALSSPAVR